MTGFNIGRFKLITNVILCHMVIFAFFCQIFVPVPAMAYVGSTGPCAPGEYCHPANHDNHWRNGYIEAGGCSMVGCPGSTYLQGIVEPGGRGCCGHPRADNLAWLCIVGHPEDPADADFAGCRATWCHTKEFRDQGCNYRPGCEKHFCKCLNDAYHGSGRPAKEKTFWHNAHTGGKCDFVNKGPVQKHTDDYVNYFGGVFNPKTNFNGLIHPEYSVPQGYHPIKLECKHCGLIRLEANPSAKLVLGGYKPQHPHVAYEKCTYSGCGYKRDIPNETAVSHGVCTYGYPDEVPAQYRASWWYDYNYCSPVHPHSYRKYCSFNNYECGRNGGYGSFVSGNDNDGHHYPWEPTEWLVKSNTQHRQLCDKCGREVASENHSIGYEKINNDDSVHIKKCGICGWNVIEGHDYRPPQGSQTYTTPQPPGWTWNNDYHYRVCEKCGYDNLKEHHAMGDWVSDGPTYHKKECTVYNCRYVQKDYHHMTSYTAHFAQNYSGRYIVDLTLQPNPNYHYRECAENCGYYEIKSHTFREFEKVIDATDTAAGYTEFWHKCDICGFEEVIRKDMGPNVTLKSVPTEASDTFTVIWEATDNETSAGDMDYIVQYSGNGTSNWVTVGTPRGETSLDISIENLEETESGRVRVRAKDSIGNWSAWAVSGAIRIIKIREPEIEVIPIGSDRMEIRWSIPPGPDVPGVTYDLDRIWPNRQDVYTGFNSSGTVEDTGLSPNTLYRYRMTAQKGGASKESNEGEAYTLANPAAEPRIENISIRNGTFVVKWSHNDNPDYTQYEIKIGGQGIERTETVTGTSYTVSGINASKPYTVYITAINKAEVRAQTVSVKKPDVSVNVSITPDPAYPGDYVNLSAVVTSAEIPNICKGVKVEFDYSIIDSGSGNVDSVNLRADDGGMNWSARVKIFRKVAESENITYSTRDYYEATFYIDAGPYYAEKIVESVDLGVVADADVQANVVRMEYIREFLLGHGITKTVGEISETDMWSLTEDELMEILTAPRSKSAMRNDEIMVLVARVCDKEGKIGYGRCDCKVRNEGYEGMVWIKDGEDGISGYFAKIKTNPGGEEEGYYHAYFRGFLENDLFGNPTKVENVYAQYKLYKPIVFEEEIEPAVNGQILPDITPITVHSGYGIGLTTRLKIQGPEGMWETADIEEYNIEYYIVENDAVAGMNEATPNLSAINASTDCMKLIKRLREDYENEKDKFESYPAYAMKLPLMLDKSPVAGEYEFGLAEDQEYSPYKLPRVYPVPETPDGNYAIIITAKAKVKFNFWVEEELRTEEAEIEAVRLIRNAITISTSMYDDDETRIME